LIPFCVTDDRMGPNRIAQAVDRQRAISATIYETEWQVGELMKQPILLMSQPPGQILERVVAVVRLQNRQPQSIFGRSTVILRCILQCKQSLVAPPSFFDSSFQFFAPNAVHSPSRSRLGRELSSFQRVLGNHSEHKRESLGTSGQTVKSVKRVARGDSHCGTPILA
jgi:hypothetical protein